jgi:DNA-binding GntR family transcriptional regulator
LIVAELLHNNEAAGRSLGEHAYQVLVKMITRLELEPGMALAERNLIEQLKLGRTPIREALQRLSVEGLVCHLPHRGMYVCEITEAKVRHIFEFRSMIDAPMARLAAMRAGEMQIHELELIDHELDASITQGDLETFVSNDRRFYESLAVASQNVHIREVVPRIFNQQARLMFFVLLKTGDWSKLARNYEDMAHAVIDAIARHQGEEAELAIRLCLIRQQREIFKLL